MIVQYGTTSLVAVEVMVRVSVGADLVGWDRCAGCCGYGPCAVDLMALEIVV